MGNFTRWLNYAKARIDSAVGQGHRELDDLEAERERELADKPWLRSDADAPTFDEAKARIEWQSKQAAREAGRGSEDEPAPTPETKSAPAPHAASSGPSVPTDAISSSAPHDAPGSSPITSPEERAAAAETAQARLEMEARERESAARLDAIRAELGIDPPEDEPPKGS